MKISDIQVTYLDHMGSDITVVNAARVSFHKESGYLWQGGGEEELCHADARLIQYLAKHNHWSPFAHPSVSFRVKAPIFVARQLVKHTVGFSWNEVSRRYVDEEPEFYFPGFWRKRADNVKQGSSEEMVSLKVNVGLFNHYEDGLEETPFELCKRLLDLYQGILKQGVCPEQARMILPQNTMTEWIWTGTLYAWARMCNLRRDQHTQRETQEVAEELHASMKELFPVSWEALKQV